MIYYTKNGNLINYNYESNSIIMGTQGNIFKVGPSICLKEYKESSLNKSIFDDVGTRFNQEMFDYFKYSFNNPSFCELYDLLYDEKLMTVLGYTMKYYEKMIDNILTMPISYVLDNFSLIYDAITKLTEECIRVVDLHAGNIIVTENGMIIIDYDKYYYDNNTSKQTLDYINKCALMSAFAKIFKNSLEKLGIDVDNDIELKNRISSMFTVWTTPLVLECKLRRYNKPIDYLMFYK